MATTKKNNFKKIKELDNRIDPMNGMTRVVTLWKYKGKKFRFTFENSNGTPCGFDFKHCIDVFKDDTWHHVADKRDILAFAKCKVDCASYYGSAYVLGKAARDFTDACIEYVRTLYS